MAKLLLLGSLLVLGVAVTMVAGACDQDRADMIQYCKDYEMFPPEPKIPPSAECCAVWQRADIPCLCKSVTEEVEKVWCMEKVVYVAEKCGKPFEPGFKCGSFTVPSLGQ